MYDYKCFLREISDLFNKVQNKMGWSSQNMSQSYQFVFDIDCNFKFYKVLIFNRNLLVLLMTCFSNFSVKTKYLVHQDKFYI